MSKHYHIAVLGAGPGGYVAALKTAQMGASVVVVEKENLGRTCLNYGCIPSKAILGSAELLHHLRHAAEMGIDVPAGASANWPKIQARKDKILQTLRTGIKGLLGARKVTIVKGRASLTGIGKVVVNKAGASPKEFTADKTILAVGSVPSRIPSWPTDVNVVCTSDQRVPLVQANGTGTLQPGHPLHEIGVGSFQNQIVMVAGSCKTRAPASPLSDTPRLSGSHTDQCRQGKCPGAGLHGS
jgi:dihydrolipoamide dehydrogenase